MALRKSKSVPAAKSAATTTQKAQRTVRKPVQAQKAAPTPPAKAQPKAAVAAVTTAPATNRTVHDVTTAYAGPSKGLTKGRSKTPIPVERFNENPGYVLTPRTTATLAPIKEKYGATPFARANIDAGVLKFAVIKGHLQHVDGDPASETARFRFTPAALETRY